MNRLLLIAFALILIGGGAAAPESAHAACIGGEDEFTFEPCGPGAGTVAAPPATSIENGSVNNGSSADPTSAFGPVMGGLMSLFAWLAGVAGVLLNETVYWTVVHMGAGVNSINAIHLVWTIMRDLSNIILIFGFLAVGICIILGVNWYGGGTKMIPILLLSAIFVNFSFFVSEAVIDVGNLFATQFYTQINGGATTLPAGGFAALGSAGNQGIAGTIMSSIGLATLFNVQNCPPKADGSPCVSGSMIYFIGFLSIILFLIVTFVLASLALILAVRFEILLLLIIIAPIGFAGLAVPKLDKYARMWWEKLFQQTITAPILLLLLYIALRIITDPNFLFGGFGLQANAAKDAYTAALTNPTPTTVASFAGVLLSFIVAMGLLMACVVAAKQLSAAGGGFVNSLGKSLGRGLVRTGTLPFRWGGKWAVAGLGGAGLEKIRTKTALGRVITVNGLFDYQIKAAADKMKGVNFGTASYKDIKEFNKQNKLELGSVRRTQTAQGSIYTASEEMAKQSAAMAKAEADLAKADTTLAQLEADWAAGRIPASNQNLYIAKRTAALGDKQKAETARTAADTARLTAQDTISKSLTKLNDKEIAELKEIKNGVESLSQTLTPQQFKSLMDNKEVSEETKGKVREARFTKITADIAAQDAAIKKADDDFKNADAAYAGGTGSMQKAEFDVIAKNTSATREKAKRARKDAIRALANSDLENAPAGFLTDDNIKDLSESTQKDLIKSGKLGPALTRKLKARDPSEQVKTEFYSPTNGRTPGKAAADTIISAKLKPEAVADLPPDILVQPEVLRILTPNMLMAMTTKLDSTTRDAVGKWYEKEIKAVMATVAAGGQPPTNWPGYDAQETYFKDRLGKVAYGVKI